MPPADPGKAILSVQDVWRSYGAQAVLRGVSLTLHENDRVGLIGRNGCGKSTLMRIMAAIDAPDAGLVTRSQGLRVSLLQQQCGLGLDLTVDDALREASADLTALVDRYHAAMDRLAATPGDCWEHREAQEECEEVQRILDAARAWDLPQEKKRVSVALQLPEGGRKLSTLSGGELRRVDLAARLLERPGVLMLDEPTNHIDTRSVEWIERFLEGYPGGCVLVTHDRYFLDRVVNRIVELEFSRTYSFPGSYLQFLEHKAVVEETEIRSEENRRALIRRELAWYKRGPKARGTKQKARINRLIEKREQGPPERHREFVFEIPEPERLGKIVLEAQDLEHGYDESTLFRRFSLIMQKDMRVGIVGPNGSGKTTLLRVLMGDEEPRKGKLIIGDATRFLYVDQAHDEIKAEQTIIDFVSNGARYWEVEKRRVYVPAYLQKFLFDKETVYMPIGNLSGGERNRLHLAKRLLRGGNFLVLDEPTNDLDLYSLRVLEETIESFNGCALIVSHDRFFLNRVCTHMLVFEDEGRVTRIDGNYDDYLLYRERREAQRKEAAPKPEKKARQRALGEAPRKLTWKEQREYERIEEDLLEAEAAVETLETEMQGPDFYAEVHRSVQETLAAYEAAKARVAQLYERWAELEAIAGDA